MGPNAKFAKDQPGLTCKMYTMQKNGHSRLSIVGYFISFRVFDSATATIRYLSLLVDAAKLNIKWTYAVAFAVEPWVAFALDASNLDY